MRKITTLLFLFVAVAGCKDVMTSPSSAGRDLSYSFSNEPEMSGPFVFRTADNPFFIFITEDRTTHLAALMAVTDPTNVIPCGGTDQLESVNIQLVAHSSGLINSIIKGRDISVWVYNRAAFLSAINNTSLCNAMATVQPLYTGTTRLVSHDNDTFFSGVHTDAFGLSGQGVVTRLSDNATFTFQTQSHGAVAADGSARQVNSSVTIR